MLLCMPATAKDVRSIYDAAAPTYDELDRGAIANFLGFAGLRQELLEQARGRTLEVAVGTGINLPLYDTNRLTEYVGLDVSPGMLEQASAKLRSLPLRKQATLIEGNVERLPFEDEAFDTIVSTFSLCVFTNPTQALAEMRRVVKQDGRLLVLEHSRSSWGVLAAYQDLTSKVVAATSRGCVWNQDIPKLLANARLEAEESRPVLGGLVTLARLVRAEGEADSLRSPAQSS